MKKYAPLPNDIEWLVLPDVPADIAEILSSALERLSSSGAFVLSGPQFYSLATPAQAAFQVGDEVAWESDDGVSFEGVVVRAGHLAVDARITRCDAVPQYIGGEWTEPGYSQVYRPRNQNAPVLDTSSRPLPNAAHLKGLQARAALAKGYRKPDDRYPHTCTRCGAPAYNGFATSECSKEECQ